MKESKEGFYGKGIKVVILKSYKIGHIKFSVIFGWEIFSTHSVT